MTRAPPWPERLQALRYDADAAAAYAPAYEHIAREVALERGAFLDVGCGPGWLAIAVAGGRPDLDAVGIDRSAAMLRVAERNKGELHTMIADFSNGLSVGVVVNSKFAGSISGEVARAVREAEASKAGG